MKENWFYKGYHVAVNSTGFGFIKVEYKKQATMVQRRASYDGHVFDDIHAVFNEMKQLIDQHEQLDITKLTTYK